MPSPPANGWRNGGTTYQVVIDTSAHLGALALERISFHQ